MELFTNAECGSAVDRKMSHSFPVMPGNYVDVPVRPKAAYDLYKMHVAGVLDKI